LPRPKYSGNQI